MCANRRVYACTRSKDPMTLRSVTFLIALALLAAACSTDASEAGAPSSAPSPDTTAGTSSTAAPDTSPEETTTAPSTASPPRSTGNPIGFDEWAAFRGGPERRGFDGDPEGNDEPDLQWQSPTGGVVESSPAVVNGLVIGGTFDNALFALDASSGEEVWRFEVGGLVRSSLLPSSTASPTSAPTTTSSTRSTSRTAPRSGVSALAAVANRARLR